MAKLFFLFSGEHDTLPFSELKSILAAEGCEFNVLEKLDQVVRLETDLNCIDAVVRRAAFIRLCMLELFCCKAEIKEIVRNVHLSNFDNVLGYSESFAIRVRHVKDYSPKIDGMLLEKKLGELVLSKASRTKVKLKNPDKILIGILTSNKFLFGLKVAEILPKPFVDRRPKKKPFFHPSAMTAKLARCMVNLSRVKAGEIVLDPFCGTGSMLIEASLIGCRALGLDIQRRMAKGTLQNLKHFNKEAEGVIVADSRKPPITKADCVVTDPPYGISATTLKRTTKQIIEEALDAARPMLNVKGRICMAAPKTLGIKAVGEAHGYKLLESHLVYVHRSLTREIAVFEKR